MPPFGPFLPLTGRHHYSCRGLMAIGHVIPVLRMFDEDQARAFYIGFLGFQIDGEHRYADDLPLYMRLSKDGCVIHLSGHHGDACPGASIRIAITGLDHYHAELSAKRYKHARPEITSQFWGRDMSIIDPFGNRLTFSES